MLLHFEIELRPSPRFNVHSENILAILTSFWHNLVNLPYYLGLLSGSPENSGTMTPRCQLFNNSIVFIKQVSYGSLFGAE